jgi:hypothetical protein
VVIGGGFIGLEPDEKLPEYLLSKSGRSVYKPNTDPASSLVASAYTLIDAGTAKVNKKGGPLKRGREGDYETRCIHHTFNVNFVQRF